MTRKIAIEVISFLFIVLFIYAAMAKLLDHVRFQAQLGQSPLLVSFAPWVSWLVPLLEIMVAVMIGVPRWRLLGFYCAFSLMVQFTAYILAILTFSEFIPCSCGGILEMLGWREHLLFNLGFVLLSLAGIMLATAGRERPGPVTRIPSNQ